MTNFGFISSIDGDFAIVEVSRTSACSMMHAEAGESCSGHCEGCASMLNKMSVKAENVVNAKVGDRVEIESASKNLLLFSLMVFLLPIIVLVATYLIICPFIGEKASVIVGLIFFVLYFVVLRFFDKKLSSYSSCKIVKVL